MLYSAKKVDKCALTNRFRAHILLLTRAAAMLSHHRRYERELLLGGWALFLFSALYKTFDARRNQRTDHTANYVKYSGEKDTSNIQTFTSSFEHGMSRRNNSRGSLIFKRIGIPESAIFHAATIAQKLSTHQYTFQ